MHVTLLKLTLVLILSLPSIGMYIFYMQTLNGKKYLKSSWYNLFLSEYSYINYSKMAYSSQKLKILTFKQVMTIFVADSIILQT